MRPFRAVLGTVFVVALDALIGHFTINGFFQNCKTKGHSLTLSQNGGGVLRRVAGVYHKSLTEFVMTSDQAAENALQTHCWIDYIAPLRETSSYRICSPNLHLIAEQTGIRPLLAHPIDEDAA